MTSIYVQQDKSKLRRLVTSYDLDRINAKPKNVRTAWNECCSIYIKNSDT